MKYLTFGIFLSILLLQSCSSSHAPSESSSLDMLQNWDTVLSRARGTEVQWTKWNGDALINAYVQDHVVPEVKKQFGITLRILPGQGNEIVSALLTEQQAGKEKSTTDMVWINGETFYQLREIDALFGPYTHYLPNIAMVDTANPFIGRDFQQPIDGMECPWGNVQMAWIYDSLRVSSPPHTLLALEQWILAHPGRFTLPEGFTGITLLKSLLATFAGGKEALSGDFNEELYAKSSQQLWQWILRLREHFWKEGKTFPRTIAQQHQLFASGEIDMTWSNNDSEVDNKIMDGTFPSSSLAYVPDFGSIQNSHYLGIVDRASNRYGAMVVINYLISPEAQWTKMQPKVWGDHTVLNVSKLPVHWKTKFQELTVRKAAPQRSDIATRAISEPHPEYMIRLFADFRKYIIEGKPL